MYILRLPLLLRWLFPSFIYEIKNKNNVFLTFDDGPTIKYTEKILAVLKEYNVSATFFCVGENVKKHPYLHSKIINQGHSVGNHTMRHLNGWKTPSKEYLLDINNASKYIKSKLFRPPYGKINFGAMRSISKKHDIIMWDIISGDFDSKCSTETVVSNVLNNVKAGSIVVFHDNEDFSEKTLAALPKIIEGITLKNLSFSSLE
ncbi:polysaccharide deacetylase family protein [Flavobacteriales bacterium]|nr:polysaccharide deacetylase family protein [Flavobacteriales bacterium]